MKLLIIGDNLRACLSLAKALYSHQIKVDILGWWNLNMEKYSSVNKYYNFPDFTTNLIKYKYDFLNILENKYDFIIPINDEGLEIVSFFYTEIESKSKTLGLAESHKLIYAKDKFKTFELFKHLDFKHPDTKIVLSETCFENCTFPFILKPQISRLTINDKIYSAQAKFINNQKDLDLWKKEVNFYPSLMQEIIMGEEYGFNFYAENGKILNFYIDKHVHGVPGNESACRCLVLPNETGFNKIKSTFEKVIEKLAWTGVGMFDFKWYQNNVYVIEFNARFWASIKMDLKANAGILKQFINRQVFNKSIINNQSYPTRKLYIHNFKNELKLNIYLLKKRKIFSFFKHCIKMIKMFLPNHFIE